MINTQYLREALSDDDNDVPWPDFNIVELPLSYMDIQTLLGLVKMDQLSGKNHSVEGYYRIEVVMNGSGLYIGVMNRQSPENFKANLFIERNRLRGRFKNFHATYAGTWDMRDHCNDVHNTYLIVSPHLFGFTGNRLVLNRFDRSWPRNQILGPRLLGGRYNARIETDDGDRGFVGKIRTRLVIEGEAGSAFVCLRPNSSQDFILDVFSGQPMMSQINPIAEVSITYNKGKKILNKSGRRLPSGALYMFMEANGTQFCGWDEEGEPTLEFGNHLTTRSTNNYYFNSKGVLMGAIPYRPYIAAFMSRLGVPGDDNTSILLGFAHDTDWRNEETPLSETTRTYFGWECSWGWCRIEVCPLGHYADMAMHTPLIKQYTCAKDGPCVFEHDSKEYEVDEMNEAEKKIVRQWWNAYLRELAREGNELSNNEADLAAKLLG